MMRVLIADDEPPAVERLRLLLAGLDQVEVVGAAVDGGEAAEMIARLKPDLVLLDIQMPRKTGLPAEDRPEIVFVTAFESFAADAFEVEAADYLLKPVRYDRLRQAIERASRRSQERAALAAQPAASPADEADASVAFWVTTRSGQVRVPLFAIDWIEAAKDYVLLHTPQRSHLLRTTMSALEERLAGSEMIRVHRSAFVRPSRVEAIERPSKWQVALVMAGGVSVPVGPSHISRVMDAVQKSRPAP